MKREVCVTLSDFDGDDILEAAVDIVGFHLRQEVPKDAWRRGQYKAMDEHVTKLRAILSAAPTAEDEASLPPPSTAARIKSAAELRAFMESPPAKLTPPDRVDA